jgi:hypothetical protein
MLRPVLLAAVISPALSLGVQAYCSAPTALYCATSYSDFSDQDEFNSCRREMEWYADEVNSYVACLQRDLEDTIQSATDEARRDADSAISDYNDAVDSFNRRAN